MSEDNKFTLRRGHIVDGHLRYIKPCPGPQPLMRGFYVNAKGHKILCIWNSDTLDCISAYNIDTSGWLDHTWLHLKENVEKCSIDWSHVAEGWNWLTEDKDGKAHLWRKMPRLVDYGWWAWSDMSCTSRRRADTFASFRPSQNHHWESCIVQRPGIGAMNNPKTFVVHLKGEKPIEGKVEDFKLERNE